MCAPQLGNRDQTDREHGIVEKELMSGRVTEEITEERKEVRRVPRATNLIGTVRKTREAKGKAKGRARAKPDTATIEESKGISEGIVHTRGPTA